MGPEVLVTKQPPREGRTGRDTISAATRPNRAPKVVGDNAGCDDSAEGTRQSHGRFASPWTIPWCRKRTSKKTTSKDYGPTNLSLLHQAQRPLIDIIFVHGLRGGSVKTWQKGGDARRFWPKLWLPMEPGFEHANIHAFGYDADWNSEKGDIFKIQDFARQLIEEMRTSPQLTKDETRPIIMLGHSMGGLVIKKAFIIAQESAEWRDRMESIFFLATPHRGSKHASLLNSLLMISRIAPSRRYISDLSKDSPSLKAIQDDFINAAGATIIYSFYETLKMKIGLSSAYIVEKESAVLGLPNERVKYADATHCDISKYKARSDPTYAAVRDSLALVVKEILDKAEAARARDVTEKMPAIKVYLGLKEPPIERRDVLPGSCQWIHAREDFRQWQTGGKPAEPDGSNTDSANDISLFWVYASPGTGKSFLASHVKAHIEATESRSTAYYYFSVGRHGSQSLAPFLRSIAYQMAMNRADVREKLYEMHQDGLAFDIDDSWTVWVKLFKKCILQLQSRNPFFWIIDAMDECEKYAELFNMLKSEAARFPLRIFITSRPTGDMERLQKLMTPHTSINCVEIPTEATMSDIRSYISHRVLEATLGSDLAAEDLAEKIQQMSSGCFLWVRLVLDELENTHTAEGKLRVMEELPEGMRPLYKRSVAFIEANERDKHISEAMFCWLVAGTRQMNLDELAEALEYDVSMSILKTAHAIRELCGQLAVLKSGSNVVELIHPTAREFLLSDAGPFTVSPPEAHARIALSVDADKAVHVTTSKLSRGEFFRACSGIITTKGPRDTDSTGAIFEGQYIGMDRKSRDKRKLSRYFACVQKSDHISGPESFDAPAISASGQHSSLALAQVPRRRGGGLVLSGNASADWDDCVAHVNLGDEGASAVSSGEESLIIGTDFGTVTAFNHRTYQREVTFNHASAVDLVHLADDAIIICTTKAIILQNLRGKEIWQSRLRFRCLCVTVLGSKVVAVVSHGHLMKWSRATGEVLQDEQLQHKDQPPTETNKYVRRGAPILAKISPEFEMVVLAYNDGCVCSWDAEDLEFIGWIKDEQGRVAKELLFNPNKNIQLLLVVYADYGLATFDTWTTAIAQSHSAPAEAPFLSAARSPNGHTFATADGRGNITLWSFEQLKIIGNIQTSSSVYRILSFTGDSRGILDVTDSSIKCWTPVAVAQHTLGRGDAVKDAITRPEPVPKNDPHDKGKELSVIATHPQLALALTGTRKGDVLGFSTRQSCLEKKNLYNHSASVLQIAISKAGLVASYDSNNRVLIGKYEADTGLVTRLNGPDGSKAEAHVKQLCFSANGKYLLLGMDGVAAVYRCADASCVGKWHSIDKEAKARFWMAVQAPESSQQQFWLIEDHKIKRFSAKSFPKAIEPSEILLGYSLAPGCQEREIAKAVFSAGSQILSVQVNFWAGMIESSTVLVFQLTKDDWGHTGEDTKQISNTLPDGSRHWQYLLGWNPDATRLIFMDRDSWICSASVSEMKKRECQRHFYLPRYLLTPNISPALTAAGDVVLPNGNELTLISGGFKFGYPATFI